MTSENPITGAPIPDRRNDWLDAYTAETQMGTVQPTPQLFDFDAIRGIIYRQRWLFVAAVGVSVLVGVVITLLSTPIYQADAKVSIKPYGQSVVEGQDVNQGFNPNQIFDYLATQTEIIKSRKLAEAVVDELNLDTRSDLLGKDIDEGRAPGMTDEKWRKAKRDIAASMLLDGVVAEVPTENWIITIGYQSESPMLAAEIANAYADVFVRTGSNKSIESNNYAVEYLKTQIDETRARLSDAEQNANVYARNNGIILQPSTGEPGSEPATLTASNLSSINARVANARAIRIEAEQRWRALQALPASQLPEVQSNPALQTTLADRAAKQAQLVELRQRYNDDFPQIQTLLSQIALLDAQIGRSSSDIKATVRNQFLVAQRQEQALEAELAGLTGDRLVEQDQQVELGVLEREAQALRDQLKSLLDRYNQLNSAASFDSGMITKIDSAMVPGDPFSPNFLKNIGLALVLGIALGAVLAMLRETLDDRIRSLDDVEEKLGLSLLGHTPYVEDRSMALPGTDRFSALMEAYSSIRAAIDFSLPRNRNVIQLTSSRAGEGKSTTSVILAELFASLGRRTLLVDADLRRPSVAMLLDIERPKVGVVEVVLGHVSLDEAVVKGVHENLDILPVGEVPRNPTEILASREMREFIERVRSEYSLVIFDSCPVMGLADAPTLAHLVDGTVFVLEANKLPFGQARTAVRRLTVAGGQVIGAVLTKYRALQAGQSYNYQYGYYEYGSDK
ncbi:GumC family protein [Erythrobacter neustonensis]|uniref:non-specific protein-tyrosine kinase n=1 Tax=Erythrobacter neustonensis TaxID=1112 RepID=A0A192D1N6_9SPHN|nr:polysaccharide biosynthesis tyrosine autokinase [Erythrobacter neustonensis]ANK12035.1 exopolysaccharide biosynthesis protein [Erythrobacter neustonensis]